MSAKSGSEALEPDGGTGSTLLLLPGAGEMGERIRTLDWSRTSLGPVQQWPQSLRMVLRIMLASRQPIWVGWGKELVYFYNDPYQSIIGGKHPWALGQPTREVWREIWPDIGPMLETAMQGDKGTYVEAQLLIMHRNGYPEETYYTFSYSPIPNDDGTVGGIICANTDDTQRVIGERQLALLRDLARNTGRARDWQEVCDQCAAALRTNTRDLPFALIYTAAPRSTRLQLESVSGIERGHPAAPESLSLEAPSVWPLAEALGKHEIQVLRDLRQAIGTALPSGPWGEPPSAAALVPLPLAGETGRSGLLIVGLNPFRLFDEHYRGFLALIAGQIAAALANAQAYEEERRRAQSLAEIDRAKTAFFSNVSHEFRTPLTLMLGPVEEAAANPLTPPVIRTQLQLAHRNSLRLLKLVNSLLDFSRIEAGRVQASFEPTDLAALTCDLASTFRSAIESAGLHFVVTCAPLETAVFIDREMWEKIVLNLLSNAFKYTLSGSIRVSLAAEDTHAVLEVADTGVGIPQHELPRLFERFHRIEGTAGRTQEGSGIGLALAAELVKLHGGTISVASELQRGTRFIVRVPLGSAHLPPERIRAAQSLTVTSTGARAFVQEALRWVPEQPLTADPEEMRELGSPDGDSRSQLTAGARIVLADDNADMRDYVRELLSPLYRIEAVADGEAALAAIHRSPPDLVLSDVMMPRLDGFGLLQAMRAHDVLRQIPFIMLSARAGEEARIEGLQAGADDYLVKPFSARELLARIGASLMLSRERRVFEQRIAADLAAMSRLREVGQECARDGHQLQTCLTAILDAAIFITGADKGNVQLLDPQSNTLKIAVHRGFESAFLEFFATVHAGETATCGRALGTATRVIAEDVQHSDLFAGTEAAAVLLEAGVRAVQSTPLISSSGKPLGMISTHSCRSRTLTDRELHLLDLLARQAADYLERREADEALRASEERFRTVVNASPAALTLMSAVRDESNRIVDFRWAYLNESAQKLICEPSGLEVEQLLGRRLKNTRPSSWPGLGLFDALSAAIETGLPQTVEAGSAQPGMGATYLNVVAPFADGGLVWFIDITPQKRTETLLREREAALREADRRKNEFLAMLAHELRNPLAPISNASELLSRSLREQPDAETAIAMIKRQVAHLTRLVDDLLDVSRITEGRIQLQRQPVDLANVIAQAVETIEPQLRAKQHSISISSSGVLPLYVHADFARMVQCIVNILNNAVKYTDPHGEITVHSRGEEALAIVEVRDTGVGITPELLPRIFDVFVQSDRTLDRSQGGLGIGLAVVKQLVDMHEGEVRASSAGIGQGASFEIRLPRISPPTMSHLAMPSPMSVRRRVLVVDDNADAANSLAMLLNLRGHETQVAYTARDALTRAGTFRPDVALLDIGLPEMDGYELARRLRANPEFTAVRLVALSGYGQEQDREKSRAAGFDQHLVKPVELSVLEQALKPE